MTVVQKVAEENGDAPQLTAAKLVYLQEHVRAMIGNWIMCKIIKTFIYNI